MIRIYLRHKLLRRHRIWTWTRLECKLISILAWLLVYCIASYIEVDAHVYIFWISRVYIQNLYVRFWHTFLSKSDSNTNVVSSIFDMRYYQCWKYFRFFFFFVTFKTVQINFLRVNYLYKKSIFDDFNVMITKVNKCVNPRFSGTKIIIINTGQIGWDYRDESFLLSCEDVLRHKSVWNW